MPISTQPSLGRKLLNWIKDHPIIITAAIIAILAVAGFLTAGFLIPIVAGGFGIVSGAIVGATTLGVIGLVTDDENKYIDDDGRPPRNTDDRPGNSAGGLGFIGLITGALFCALVPPAGLVALSLLVGAAIFGMTAGIMKGIQIKINQRSSPDKPEIVINNSLTTCHETFGSRPEIGNTTQLEEKRVTTPVVDTDTVVQSNASSATLHHRSPALGNREELES